MNILITGSTGYLGAGLVSHLSSFDGIKVTGLYRSGHKRDKLLESLTNGQRSKTALVKADIDTDELSPAGIDTVIHCAAVRNIGLCEKNPEKAYRTNVRSLQRLLEDVKRSGVKRFIYISSQSVYGLGRDEADENSLVDPRNVYAKTKYMGELITELELKNREYIILRPSRIYGWGTFMNEDNFIHTTFPQKCLEGQPLKISGTGEQAFNIIHIKDVCRAVSKLIAAGFDKWNTTYNMADSKKTSLNQIAGCFTDWCGEKGLKTSIQYVREENVPKNIPNLKIEKLKKAVGWNPKNKLKEAIWEIMNKKIEGDFP